MKNVLIYGMLAASFYAAGLYTTAAIEHYLSPLDLKQNPDTRGPTICFPETGMLRIGAYRKDGSLSWQSSALYDVPAQNYPTIFTALSQINAGEYIAATYSCGPGYQFNDGVK